MIMNSTMQWRMGLALVITVSCAFTFVGGPIGGVSVFGAASAINMATSFGEVSWTVYLAYLVYLLPIAALATLALPFTGRSNKHAASALALLAIVFPVLVFFGPTFAMMNMSAEERAMASAFMPSGISMLGLGAWLTLFAGVTLLMAQIGRLSRSPTELFELVKTKLPKTSG
jgi:hypothetical protein